MRAVIFSGGSYGDPSFYKNELKEDDFVITADAGADFAQRLGIKINVAIGDFDTLDVKKIVADEIIKLNPEKDYTDSFEAVFLAKERGFSEVLMFGASGSRLDHSLANIFLLKKAKDMGINLTLCDENNIVYITENELLVKKKEGYHLSVIQLTDAIGITLKGLYYPLNEKDAALGDMIGISNEFTEEEAKISVKKGTLLVILSKD